MRKNPLFFIAMFLTVSSFAQSISIKKDVIYVDSKAVGNCKMTQKQPLKYAVSTLYGKALITIHYSRMEIKGVPGYIVTFLNDGKQAMIEQRAKTAESFVAEIMKSHLIENEAVNEQAEAIFINNHPLPEGYTDIDKLIEY